MQSIIITTKEPTYPLTRGIDNPQRASIVDEIKSHLEYEEIDTVSVSVHHGDVVGELTKWAADDEAGYDAIIDKLHALQLVGDVEAVRARRLQPGEPGYFEPVNSMALRADLAAWQDASLAATLEVMTAKGPDIMRVFSKHHSALIAILQKHKLMPVPTGFQEVLLTEEKAPQPVRVISHGNCGNCLMERVQIVPLLPDGTCPKCGDNYRQRVRATAAAAGSDPRD